MWILHCQFALEIALFKCRINWNKIYRIGGCGSNWSVSLYHPIPNTDKRDENQLFIGILVDQMCEYIIGET